MEDIEYQTLIISSDLRLPDQVVDIDSSIFLQQENNHIQQDDQQDQQEEENNHMQQNDKQDQQEEENNHIQQDDQQDQQQEENNFMNQNGLVQNSKMHWIKQEIELFPEGQIWTKRNVSCFINEIDDFKKVPTLDDGIRTSIFHFVHQDEPNFYISVHVSFAIHVYASIYWVFSKWIKKEKKCYSLLRTRNRIRTKPKYQLHYYYELKISKLSPGTGAILLRKPLMCTGIYDYSNIFNFFAKRLIENGLNFNDDTEFLLEYYHIFYQSKCRTVTSLKDLKNDLNGYIQLNIEECRKKKKLCKISYNEKMYYIQSGIFISTFAESILKNNNIVKVFLVYTTWKVMPGYVTSILMGAAKNTGIPLSIAFGKGETKSLYLMHILAFKHKLNINIEDFVIESDQGKAIDAICLRHLLVSLKCSRIIKVSMRKRL